MEDSGLQVPRILHSLACFAEQFAPPLFVPEFEKNGFRAGRVVGSEFDRSFDLVAIFIGGIGKDLATPAHGRALVFPNCIDGPALDSLCASDLQEIAGGSLSSFKKNK